MEMRNRKPGHLIDGPLQPGAIPWRDLPGWVQERLTNRPWDNTEDDKKVQSLFEGYFIVVNPYSSQRELWVSNPPRHKNGCSLVCPIRWVDEPQDAVDERILFAIRKYDPERGIDRNEADKMRVAALERSEKDKRIRDRLADLQRREEMSRILTADSLPTGIISVVPQNLT
jgi:hypothetical protein